MDDVRDRAKKSMKELLVLADILDTIVAEKKKLSVSE